MQGGLMRFRLLVGQVTTFLGMVLVVACASSLAGCGEIAFKRGSGPDALAADRRSCQGQNSDPAAVRACLAQAGWHVADIEPGAAPAAAASPPPPQSPTATSPGAIAAPASSQPAAAPRPATPKTLIVGNWWRIGTGSADLHAAGDACVAKLGPSNAPDAGYHTVTPEFYACMRSAGWHGPARAGG